MKRIDVEKLKERLESYFEDAIEIDIDSGLSRIAEIIDSLAVEVPEAKPGAIEKAIDLLAAFVDVAERSYDTILESVYRQDISSARAELSALQSENKALKKTLAYQDARYISLENQMIETQAENKAMHKTVDE